MVNEISWEQFSTSGNELFLVLFSHHHQNIRDFFMEMFQVFTLKHFHKVEFSQVSSSKKVGKKFLSIRFIEQKLAH